MNDEQNKYTINSSLTIQSSATGLKIVMSGDILHTDCSTFLEDLKKYFIKKPKQVVFIAEHLREWDSSLLVVIFEALQMAKAQNIPYDISQLPENIQQLIKLAFAVDRKPSHHIEAKRPFLENIGFKAFEVAHITRRFLHYLGDIFRAIGRCFSAQSIMRGIDFWAALEDCGPRAIAIVSLISFLVGLILAFVGAVQLQTFGAQIYIASLVTIGMCRIMGAIMVGIIMAGRTGSSYAATIGTMQVNEELDALKTMGLSKIDFLVMPRLFALLLAMPILTMLSDIMGMIGGAFVGIFMMHLPYQEYWKYAFQAFQLNHFLIGIFHGICFGFIITLCGCYSGLTCGRNADSVGVATTKSVVYAIVWMIVATGIITVICQELGL